MYSVLTIVIIIIGILLGAIVLIQNPKGGGLSGSFGGVGQQLLGARRSTDVVEKLTWGFAGGLLFLCICTGFFVEKTTTATTATPTNSENVEYLLKNQPLIPQQQQAPAAAPAPAADPAAAPAPGQ